MIVPMKKVTLVVCDKDKDASLARLRTLGLLHLEQRPAPGDRLAAATEKASRVETALTLLRAYEPKDKRGEAAQSGGLSGGEVVEKALSLADERKSAQDSLYADSRELTRLENWGEVDPADFEVLSAAGVALYPYELSKAKYLALGDTPLFTVHTGKDTVCVVAVGEALEGEAPFALPSLSTKALRERAAANTAKIESLDAEIEALSAQIPAVEEAAKSAKAELEFETARAGMEAVSVEGESAPVLSLVTGYAPAPELGRLKRAAAEAGWALAADDPADDDEAVPTLLHNNKLVSLIYPLTNFLEMVPGYREQDISGWFLLFFTLFFGMIFGDAGYGCILFLISVFGIAKTAKKGTPPFFNMLLLLSVSNIIWGLLTCTWFAVPSDKLPALLRDISFAPISTAKGTPDTLVTQNLMRFCFTVGLIHLFIAHVKAFFVKVRAGTLAALADLGQLFELVGMYWVIICLVVTGVGFGGVVQASFTVGGFTLKAWPVWCLGFGFALNFIFANYVNSILRSILASFANIIPTVLGVTNVFSDIMSYIRLWAVGLAGASLAGTVNNLAAGMAWSPAVGIVWHFVVFAVILVVFGHSFNMVLNVLSVLVHGVRLNTLEFSSNLGLGWTGFAYKPFGRE